MRLQEIMSTKIETIEPEELVSAAAERMKTQSVHHLVVGRGKEVLGIVAERDLVRRPPSDRVGDVMVADTMRAPPEMKVREAANILRGRVNDAILVMEGERLVGIVTIQDFLELIGKGLQGHTPRAESRNESVRRRGPSSSARR